MFFSIQKKIAVSIYLYITEKRETFIRISKGYWTKNLLSEYPKGIGKNLNLLSILRWIYKNKSGHFEPIFVKTENYLRCYETPSCHCVVCMEINRKISFFLLTQPRQNVIILYLLLKLWFVELLVDMVQMITN